MGRVVYWRQYILNHKNIHIKIKEFITKLAYLYILILIEEIMKIFFAQKSRNQAYYTLPHLNHFYVILYIDVLWMIEYYRN